MPVFSLGLHHHLFYLSPWKHGYTLNIHHLQYVFTVGCVWWVVP